MKKPIVSLLMCVHSSDDPDRFRRALSSMVDQTYDSLLLNVFVDGVVSADVEDVLSQFTDINVYRSSFSQGLSSGLNFLIDISLPKSIEYFIRMDSDDFSYPDRVEKQVKFMECNKEVVVSGTWCREFNELNYSFDKKMPISHDKLLGFSVIRSPLIHPTVIFRRSVFDLGYRYNSKILSGQDYDLWTRIMADGLIIANLPETLLDYYVGPNFFIKRSGFMRIYHEFRMRVYFSYRVGLLTPLNFTKISAFCLSRILPAWAKKILYSLR